MCFKHERTERRDEARRRLRERPTPARTTRLRGNPEVDQRDLARGLERLEALVGR